MQRTTGNAAGGMAKPPAASFATILDKAKGTLPKAASGEVAAKEKELAGLKDSSAMPNVFVQLAKVWETNNEQKIAAYYNGLASKLEKSEKKLTFAAQLFLELMQQENDPAVQMWEAQQAVNLAEISFTIDSSKEETKLALATGYIEGTGEPMKGVQLLLGIVRQKPNDIPANLLLGKMSVQSGQLDKAIGRFETVLSLDSVNKEALYYLAEAYKGKGENKKAISLLEQCKRLINDKEFSNKADEEIKALK